MLKLTSQSDRVTLLLHIIDTMNGADVTPVTVKDLELITEQEVTKRSRHKPCVAEGRVFKSTIDAARYLAHHRRDLWENSKAAQRMDAHAVTENLRNRVKNWCNRDNVHGYYWI